MKEKFAKIKLTVNSHKDDIRTFVYWTGGCLIGYFVGRVIGQYKGVLQCNEDWMNFDENLQEKED